MIFYDSWCKDKSKGVNNSYALSNYQKIPVIERAKNNTTSNVKDFHARFSVLSALRSPMKLKLWNCSHLILLPSFKISFNFNLNLLF